MLDDRDVAEALGDLCDGLSVSEEELAAARQALSGPVVTTRGERLYYVQIETMALDNVDTAEGIWSVPVDGLLRMPDGYVIVDLADESRAFEEQVFPLASFADAGRIARLVARESSVADPERLAAWAAFTTRVLEPL